MVESALVLTMAHAFTLAERLLHVQPTTHVRHCTVVVATFLVWPLFVCVPGAGSLAKDWRLNSKTQEARRLPESLRNSRATAGAQITARRGPASSNITVPSRALTAQDRVRLRHLAPECG